MWWQVFQIASNKLHNSNFKARLEECVHNFHKYIILFKCLRRKCINKVYFYNDRQLIWAMGVRHWEKLEYKYNVNQWFYSLCMFLEQHSSFEFSYYQRALWELWQKHPEIHSQYSLTLLDNFNKFAFTFALTWDFIVLFMKYTLYIINLSFLRPYQAL